MVATAPVPAALRIVAGVALIGGYAVVSTWLMTVHAQSPLTPVLILGPMVVAIVVGAWRAGWRLIAALLALGAVAGALRVLQGHGFAPEPLYVAQQVGIHVALGAGFASTLLPPRVPLISRLAAQLHPLTPAMEAYARRCTMAWVAYFAAMAIASLAIYCWAPFPAWTLFSNFVTPLGILLMLVGEHLLRYRLHPEFERVTLASAWHAWTEHQRDRSRSPAGPIG